MIFCPKEMWRSINFGVDSIKENFRILSTDTWNKEILLGVLAEGYISSKLQV